MNYLHSQTARLPFRAVTHSTTIETGERGRTLRLLYARPNGAIRNCHVGDQLHPHVTEPEVPVRVFLKSQLMAALRQGARPIIIEDPDLALPFTRMLRARELQRTVGGLVAEAMSYAISRYYGADIEAHWYNDQSSRPSCMRHGDRLSR